MDSYLSSYGAGDERRTRLIRRWSFIILGIVVAGLVAYFSLRDRHEKAQIANFLELLRKKDYRAAYTLWGCTAAHPCRDYNFERFLEDWGPKSPNKDIANAHLSNSRSCTVGVIAFVDVGHGDPIALWVNRGDLVIGFAPWPVCTPKMRPSYGK